MMPSYAALVEVREELRVAADGYRYLGFHSLRSNRAKVRTDPEYGHVSKVFPPRNPSAG
jgi:hypothetical protein